MRFFVSSNESVLAIDTREKPILLSHIALSDVDVKEYTIQGMSQMSQLLNLPVLVLMPNGRLRARAQHMKDSHDV